MTLLFYSLLGIVHVLILVLCGVLVAIIWSAIRTCYRSNQQEDVLGNIDTGSRRRPTHCLSVGTLASTMLCLLALIAVRISFHWEWFVKYTEATGMVSMETGMSEVGVLYFRAWVSPQRGMNGWLCHFGDPYDEVQHRQSLFRTLWLHWGSWTDGSGYPRWRWLVPLWPIILLTGILPWKWLWPRLPVRGQMAALSVIGLLLLVSGLILFVRGDPSRREALVPVYIILLLMPLLPFLYLCYSRSSREKSMLGRPPKAPDVDKS